jgi:leucine dehydrogenase
MSVFEHHEFDEHEQVLFCRDRQSGLQAIIAVHNTNLGPSLGGCRMWPYADSAEALNDVLRLSRGMTYKAAMANLKLGGGKSVIIGNPRTDKTPQMMAAMGRFINSAQGAYITAEDSGISIDDLNIMAEHSSHVSGNHSRYSFSGGPADGNPAPAAAYGVFVGLKATVKHKLKTDLKGLRVAIQGLGHVGFRLAQHLKNEGAELFVTDIYQQQVHKAEEMLGARVVSPEEIMTLDVDVFAPCALGAILNERSISQLKCSVIAGAANNQLAHEEHGQLLTDAGILYAPDYVINAGGVIDIYHQKMEDSSAAALKAHLEGIGDTLTQIYQRSDTEGRATNVISNLMAEHKCDQ